jgi:hypothetical protein
MSKSKLKALSDILGIDNRFTKITKKIKQYNNVKRNMTLIEDTNFMCDLVTLPTTKKGFRLLLTVTDLANDDFDMEPLKNKTPQDIVKAFKIIEKRQYLGMPMNLTTDNGTEFKGQFEKYLDDNDVYHRVTMPYRHIQTANIENLNRQIVRLLFGYMNKKEISSGRDYNEWTDVIDTIRVELNKLRHKDLPKFNTDDYPLIEPPTKKPEFEIGQLVYHKLFYPKDALGKKASTSQFREGDIRWSTESRPIENIFVKVDEPTFRYQLKGMNYVSFYPNELMLSKETDEKINVKKIIGKKKVGKTVHYQVWFQGDLKKNAVWLPKTQLLEDGLNDYIDDFEANG